MEDEQDVERSKRFSPEFVSIPLQKKRENLHVSEKREFGPPWH